jgi:hypothetical protein
MGNDISYTTRYIFPTPIYAVYETKAADEDVVNFTPIWVTCNQFAVKHE